MAAEMIECEVFVLVDSQANHWTNTDRNALIEDANEGEASHPYRIFAIKICLPQPEDDDIAITVPPLGTATATVAAR